MTWHVKWYWIAGSILAWNGECMCQEVKGHHSRRLSAVMSCSSLVTATFERLEWPLVRLSAPSHHLVHSRVTCLHVGLVAQEQHVPLWAWSLWSLYSHSARSRPVRADDFVAQSANWLAISILHPTESCREAGQAHLRDRQRVARRPAGRFPRSSQAERMEVVEEGSRPLIPESYSLVARLNRGLWKLEVYCPPTTPFFSAHGPNHHHFQPNQGAANGDIGSTFSSINSSILFPCPQRLLPHRRPLPPPPLLRQDVIHLENHGSHSCPIRTATW